MITLGEIADYLAAFSTNGDGYPVGFRVYAQKPRYRPYATTLDMF